MNKFISILPLIGGVMVTLAILGLLDLGNRLDVKRDLANPTIIAHR